MGSSGSKIVKKIFGHGPNSKDKEMRKKHHFPIPHIREENHEVNTIVAKLPSNLGPVIMYRQGSMYFDEDGDLAHEFYVEVKEGRKSKMRRVYNNLRPQGTIKLQFPRLHSDCPVILYVL